MNTLLFKDQTQPRRKFIRALVIALWSLSSLFFLYTFSFGVQITPDIPFNAAMIAVGGYWVYSLQFTRKLALSFLVIALLLLWISDLMYHRNAELVRWFSGITFAVTSLAQVGLARGKSNFWRLMRVQLFRGPLELLAWVMNQRK